MPTWDDHALGLERIRQLGIELISVRARDCHRRASPPVPALMRWLDNYGEAVAPQLATRSSLDPNSIGAVEAALRQVERAFLGRSQSFGNRARLNQTARPYDPARQRPRRPRAGPTAYENASIPAAASRRVTGRTTTGAAGLPC
jgi:hypothetical protein